MKVKLILVIVSILSITIGLAPWSAIKIQERQLLGASEQRLRALHGMLRNTIVPTCMLSGDPDSIQTLIETITERQGIYAVRLFDTTGLIKYSSRPAERGERLSQTELVRYYGKASPLVLSSEDLANNEDAVTHTLVEPILNRPTCSSCHDPAQKVLGVLEVSLSISELWGQIWTLRRFAATATVLALCVIAVGIWVALTYFVDKPLQNLVSVMGRVAQGDLGARTTVQKGDELGHLARNLNAMIAAQQIAQQEIERYHQERLARADRLATIGEMAAAIAHEIRNPLTGIRGVLSVLGHDLSSEDPRRDIIREIDLLIDRLNKSVEDILVYSRPSRPQPRMTEVSDAVNRALTLTEGEARKAGIHILAEPLPDPVPGRGIPMAKVDAQQVQQVFVNLILNAIQATAAGGRILIRTRLRAKDGVPTHVCVNVEDTGKGMTPEEVEKAFQPFFSTKAQGTGLGLAIAKQIVENNEGRISLRSASGKGTCVEVEFPAYFPPPA